MKLNELRNRIDTIDGKIVKLLVERFEIVEQIMSLKSEIEDNAREEEVLKKISDLTNMVDNQVFFINFIKIFSRRVKEYESSYQNNTEILI